MYVSYTTALAFENRGKTKKFEPVPEDEEGRNSDATTRYVDKRALRGQRWAAGDRQKTKKKFGKRSGNETVQLRRRLVDGSGHQRHSGRVRTRRTCPHGQPVFFVFRVAVALEVQQNLADRLQSCSPRRDSGRHRRHRKGGQR